LPELARPEEEAEGHAALGVMDRVSVADPPHRVEAKEERDRQPPVHQAVVHDDVGEAEGRHAGADPDRHSGGDAVQVATHHDEDHRDRRVQRRERVVLLEAAAAARVVRAVYGPEPVVPHAAVEQARPRLHQRGDDEGDAGTDRDERGGAELRGSCHRAHRALSLEAAS
jgi:hypothetical protein